MTRPASARPGRAAGAAGQPARVVALAVLATAGAGIVWFALAMTTGLIFHFLPGATFLTGAWTYRWRGSGRPASWLHVAIILVAAAIAAAATILVLVAAGRPLDNREVTAAVAAVGALLSAAWLRRAGTRTHDVVPPGAAIPLTSDGGAADR